VAVTAELQTDSDGGRIYVALDKLVAAHLMGLHLHQLAVTKK
jgi:hypothetical protein